MTEDIKSLYGMKGEIITTIEIAQAKLNEINKQIIELMNKGQQSVSEVKQDIVEVK